MKQEGRLAILQDDKIMVFMDKEDSMGKNELGKHLTFYPSLPITSIFTTDEYLLAISQPKRGISSLWKTEGQILIYSLDEIRPEETLTFQDRLLAYCSWTDEQGEDYFVYLDSRFELRIYNLAEKCVEKVQDFKPFLTSPADTAQIISVQNSHMLAVHTSSSKLVLLNQVGCTEPIVVDLEASKILSVVAIPNTPLLVIALEHPDGEESKVLFHQFEIMRNDDSIGSLEEAVNETTQLESVISSEKVLDLKYIETLENILALTLEENDQVILHNLKIKLNDDMSIEDELVEVGRYDLPRGANQITTANIQEDSVLVNESTNQFSVCMEYFVEENLKFYHHEFSNQKQKNIVKGFFGAVKQLLLPQSAGVDPDAFSKEEMDEILYSRDIDQICAEISQMNIENRSDAYSQEQETSIVRTSHKSLLTGGSPIEYIKYNLADVKKFVDMKYDDILNSIDMDSSLEHLNRVCAYVRSLTCILNAILLKRESQARMKADSINQLDLHESDKRDIASIQREIDHKELLHQRLFFLKLFVEHGIIEKLLERAHVLQAKHQLKSSNKEKICNEQFNVLSDIKFSYPLMIDLVLSTAELEGIYPFENPNDIFDFMSRKEISISTLNFVVTYMILDLTQDKSSLLNSDQDSSKSLKNALEKVQGYSETFAYWAIDELVSLVSKQKEFDTQKDHSDIMQKLANKVVEKVVMTGDTEYLHIVLQGLQALGLEKQASLVRSNISLFSTKPAFDNSEEATGNIRSLKVDQDKFPMLIYSHCYSGNFKQAEVLLKSQEKQGSNTDYAFTIFASFLIKKSMAEYLLDMDLSPRQHGIIAKIFKSEPALMKYYVSPKLEEKDVPKAKLKNFQMIKNNYDYDEHKELKEKVHFFRDSLEAREPIPAEESPNLNKQPEGHIEPSPHRGFPTIDELSEDHHSIGSQDSPDLTAGPLASKFKSNKKEMVERTKEKGQNDNSPDFLGNRLGNWYEQSDKKYKARNSSNLKHFEETKEDMIHEEYEEVKITKTSHWHERAEGKQLFATPLGKKRDTAEGLYEPSQDTLKKLDDMLNE